MRRKVEEAKERKAAAATKNKAAGAARLLAPPGLLLPSTRHERSRHSRPQWAQQMPMGARKQLPSPRSHCVLPNMRRVLLNSSYS